MSIAFEQVTFGYTKQPVLDRVSFTLPDTGVTCLFGESGCGKTTVLRLLGGLEHPWSGRITGLSESRVAAVFQENRLLPWASVLENVRLPLTGPDARERAAWWVERVGLREVADTFPASLSGGMQRRVALARALAAPADLLLLDEPFTGLDAGWMEQISGYILEVYHDRPVVLVTHQPEETAVLGADIWNLSGPPLSGCLSVGQKNLGGAS